MVDKTLLGKAIEVLNIQGVFLLSAETRCKEGFLPPFFGIEKALTPQHRGAPTGKFHVIAATQETGSEAVRTVIFHFGVGTRLVDGNDAAAAAAGPAGLGEDAIYVEFTAEFCAHYALRQGADETELQVAFEEFAKHNVGYHVWPYWREYVQSTCGRMGIPAIPVPFLLVEGVEGNGVDTPK